MKRFTKLPLSRLTVAALFAATALTLEARSAQAVPSSTVAAPAAAAPQPDSDAYTACLNQQLRCNELRPGLPMPIRPGGAVPSQHIMNDADLLGGKLLPLALMTRAEAVSAARALGGGDKATVTVSQLTATQLRTAEQSAGLDLSEKFSPGRLLWIVRVDAPFKVRRSRPGTNGATLQGYVVLYDQKTHAFLGVRAGRAALSSVAIARATRLP